VGEPCTVPRGTDAAGQEQWQADIEQRLHATFQAARQALG